MHRGSRSAELVSGDKRTPASASCLLLCEPASMELRRDDTASMTRYEQEATGFHGPISRSRLKNTSSRMHDTIITFLLHKLYPPELSPRHDIRTSSPRVLHNTRLHNLKPSPLIKRPQTKVSAQRIFGNCISPHHRAPQKVE